MDSNWRGYRVLFVDVDVAVESAARRLLIVLLRIVLLRGREDVLHNTNDGHWAAKRKRSW